MMMLWGAHAAADGLLLLGGQDAGGHSGGLLAQALRVAGAAVEGADGSATLTDRVRVRKAGAAVGNDPYQLHAAQYPDLTGACRSPGDCWAAGRCYRR